MKLEFFEDGFDGGPLVLLYGGEPAEVSLLREAIHGLAKDTQRLALHELPFVQSVDGCRLRAMSAERDVGVVLADGPADFEWTLAAASWLQVAELLDPFCDGQGSSAFQYLNPVSGAAVIYSTDRAW